VEEYEEEDRARPVVEERSGAVAENGGDEDTLDTLWPDSAKNGRS
jgi:hypothetical protein